MSQFPKRSSFPQKSISLCHSLITPIRYPFLFCI
jgi:hypothetical protein